MVNVKILINNNTFNIISKDKILGVFVDDHLTWSHHVKHLSKKISSSIWLLSKIKKFLTKDHRAQFYKHTFSHTLIFAILSGEVL